MSTLDLDQPDSSEAFSRTGYTSPLGKLTSEIERFKVSDATFDRLRSMAAEADMPMAEFLRYVLDGHAFGFEHVARMAADRILRIGAMRGVNGVSTPQTQSTKQGA